jgi:hypothetical protein
MRSRPVVEFAARMFTCWSDSTVAMSDNSRVRSSASTWTATTNDVGFPSDHDTSIIRSGSRRSVLTLGQSDRWTLTPCPRVTNPTMPSPGTGVQQRPSFTHTSGSPLTMTPCETSVREIRTGRASGTSSVTSSSPVPLTVRERRATTDCGDTCPSPTAT